MIVKRLGLALALAALLCVPARAQSTKEAPAGSGQRYQGVVIVDPTSGNAAPVGTGTQNLATAQATATTTASQLVAARANRAAVTVENLGTTPVYLGSSSGVTSSTGFLLPGTIGATVTIPTQGAVFGVVGTGTANVAILETY